MSRSFKVGRERIIPGGRRDKPGQGGTRFAGMPIGVPAEAHNVVWVEDELERGPKMAGRVRFGGHVLTV
jgi:hypothetical protein